MFNTQELDDAEYIPRKAADQDLKDAKPEDDEAAVEFTATKEQNSQVDDLSQDTSTLNLCRVAVPDIQCTRSSLVTQTCSEMPNQCSGVLAAGYSDQSIEAFTSSSAEAGTGLTSIEELLVRICKLEEENINVSKLLYLVVTNDTKCLA